MNKNKGYTLVELLATIIILGIVLTIAIPTIKNVVKESKLKTLQASAELIAKMADEMYEAETTANEDYDPSILTCSDLVNLDPTQYGSCTLSFDSNENAVVLLLGQEGGKFDDMSCSGTKDNMVCVKGTNSGSGGAGGSGGDTP